MKQSMSDEVAAIINNRLRNGQSEARRVARMVLNHIDDPHARGGYAAEWPWLKRNSRS